MAVGPQTYMELTDEDISKLTKYRTNFYWQSGKGAKAIFIQQFMRIVTHFKIKCQQLRSTVAKCQQLRSSGSKNKPRTMDKITLT
jgi:threonine aldolase